MALSDIALCSKALAKLGAEAISSFEDGSYEAEVATSLYGSTRDALLSSYPFSFASGQRSIPKLTTTPVADFGYAYQLPSDFLRALSVGTGTEGRGIEYRISERRIHADAGDTIILTYIFRPDESTFPPFFDQCLIAHLAAEFCIPITDSTSRADLMAGLAEKSFRGAKLIDSQQQTPVALEDFTLIDVRG